MEPHGSVAVFPDHQSALYLPQSFALAGSGFARAPDPERALTRAAVRLASELDGRAAAF